MKKCFIKFPYIEGKKECIEKGHRYCWVAQLEGYIPYSADLYLRPFLGDSMITDKHARQRIEMELLKESDEVRIYADEVTEDIIDIFKAARENNIPIKFFNADMEEIQYDKLIINTRIGRGYRSIIEEYEGHGGRSYICPYAEDCDGRCTGAETGEEIEGNKGRGGERFSEWIFARFGSRNH